MKKFLFLALAVIVFAACEHPDANQKTFVDFSGIDSSVKPR